MAARSLFHCTASRAIPHPLHNEKSRDDKSNGSSNMERISKSEDSEMVAWLESFERQDWISYVGGTSQDSMTYHIVVAAALVVWYPSLVKSTLAMLCVHSLLKLVMAMYEKYSSTAAEILAEDVFHQMEYGYVTSVEIRESLVGILLPSLAMADVLAFLHVIERQIWSTASDSPVHIVSLMTVVTPQFS